MTRTQGAGAGRVSNEDNPPPGTPAAGRRKHFTSVSQKWIRKRVLGTADAFLREQTSRKDAPKRHISYGSSMWVRTWGFGAGRGQPGGV